MNRSRTWRAVAVILALSLAAAGCGRDDDDSGDSDDSSTDDTSASSASFIDPAEDCEDYQPTQGISGDTITVGTVRPAQGPYAIYDTVTKGVEKFFDAANAKGGVKAGDGKSYQIKLLKEDDGYDPGRTPDAVKKLVEQDQVFAMVGQIGTENNLSVRTYINDKCVPSVALATGSPEWGKAAEYPWFIGGLPSYAAEARVALEFLEKDNPDATIALLYQNDDFGKSYQAAIEKYIEDTGSQMSVVAQQPYDPNSGQTTEGVTTQLAQSGADVFFVGIGGTPCPRTLTFIPADWQPTVYVSITCSGKIALSLAGGKDEGIYSTQAQLDAASPADQANPKVQQFIQDGQAQGLTMTDIEGGIVSAGWGFASIFARALELSPTVERADIMNTLYSMQDENFGLMRDEMSVNTNDAEDPWLFEQLRMVHREGGQWVQASELVEFDGESNEFVGG
ncbi:MAG TPA: ABC transporter substrate-binding protein [Microthrixaceae bacterium]|nr:ABC transporter substrate-binding protein [Microthrixaceae bacterium]